VTLVDAAVVTIGTFAPMLLAFSLAPDKTVLILGLGNRQRICQLSSIAVKKCSFVALWRIDTTIAGISE
jgi:hypothetical protein